MAHGLVISGNSFFWRLMTRGSNRPRRRGLTTKAGHSCRSPWHIHERVSAKLKRLALPADPGGCGINAWRFSRQRIGFGGAWTVVCGSCSRNYHAGPIDIANISSAGCRPIHVPVITASGHYISLWCGFSVYNSRRRQCRDIEPICEILAELSAPAAPAIARHRGREISLTSAALANPMPGALY